MKYVYEAEVPRPTSLYNVHKLGCLPEENKLMTMGQKHMVDETFYGE